MFDPWGIGLEPSGVTENEHKVVLSFGLSGSVLFQTDKAFIHTWSQPSWTPFTCAIQHRPQKPNTREYLLFDSVLLDPCRRSPTLTESMRRRSKASRWPPFCRPCFSQDRKELQFGKVIYLSCEQAQKTHLFAFIYCVLCVFVPCLLLAFNFVEHFVNYSALERCYLTKLICSRRRTSSSSTE